MRGKISLLFNLIIIFISLEIFLRVQQILGPLTDLEFKQVTLEELSNTLNHLSPPNRINVHPVPDGTGKFFTVSQFYDAHSVRVDRLQPRNPQALKILFLGDSFMQGYDDEHTIPHQVWKFLQEGNLLVETVNAGYTSYSPAIFVPLAKKLIPIFRPDYIVVDIDETDLTDDAVRYEHLAVRDETGSMAAVRPTTINYESLAGRLRIRKNPSFVARYFLKHYHNYVRMPRLIRKYRGERDVNPLKIPSDPSPDAAEKYKKEVEIFEKNLSDLCQTLIRAMGDKEKILFAHHPQLQHLSSANFAAGGEIGWNHLVSDSLERVTRAHGIAYYDATEDLKREFGGHPENYYWKNDMHFNFEGQRVYAEAIARQLSTRLKKG